MLAEKVKVEIESSGGNAIRFACDIRDEDAVIQSVTEIYKQCDKIHGLVNNAGGQFPSPAEHISQKGFETVVRTNLVGGFLFCREIYNQGMIDSGGAIVNITADMWNGMPSMSHSGAARAGMDNLTKTLAYEWGHAGVRVNSVAPGYIASSGLDTYEGIVKKIIPRLKESVHKANTNYHAGSWYTCFRIIILYQIICHIIELDKFRIWIY